MEGSSKFLPDSVSGALKSVVRRAFGAALVCIGAWAGFALFFHNPYLDGFATASSFGSQGVMGNIVGFFRYGIGFIPALFLFMCVVRSGFALAVHWDDETAAPEYNILRGFIAICAGAAGFGMIAPRATYGGMAGAIAARDAVSLMGGWSALLGIACLGVFFVMVGILLHIKLDYVRACAHAVWRTVLWLLAVFHLRRMTDDADADEYDEDAPEDEEETEEDAEEEVEDEKPAKKRAPARKSARRAVARADEDDAPEWELPDPKFLKKSVLGKNNVTPELKQNAAAMEVHFAEFGVRGRVVGICPGPVVTLYKFEPESGTRFVNISKTTADMTRAMATVSIRIAHIPSTNLIGVEMANATRQYVYYQTLMSAPLFVNSKYTIPLALGVDIGGSSCYYDLAKMPHMLVAGRTGSGKSVFVQTIITSIVYHFTPDKCKLMIIDPKGVDFGFWDDIPHLITPIVKLDPQAAINALKWAVREMDDRYQQMKLLNARNIATYNEIVAAKRAAGEVVTKQVPVGTDPETGALEFETQEVDLSDMPYIVIIIDEVADLMALARKDVEMCVMRIAQKARAAGIHLVMATQRPDATVITGTIKANFPTRISFQARSNIDSRTTLGDGGAENLLAMGDMLFSEGGKPAVRIHSAYISDEELNKLGDFLRSQGEPEYAAGVQDAEMDVSAAIPGAIGGGASGGKGDELYEQAKEIVLRDKKTSISYLQRRLSVGYNKSATLIERMEQDGILSAPDAKGKRQILV